MKGPRLYSQEERVELYEAMVRRPLSFSEKDLVRIIQNSRLDARLAEVATEHLRDYWWKYDARTLNKKLKVQPWGAAIKPLLLQILDYCQGEPEARFHFSSWAKDALQGIKNVAPQLYFIPTIRPRSRSLDREVDEALPSFRASGFFAKDLLFNKGQPGHIKLKPQQTSSTLSTADLLKLSLIERIKAHMKDKNPQQLQEKWGIDRTTFSDLRLGRMHRLSLKKLSRISDLLVQKKHLRLSL